MNCVADMLGKTIVRVEGAEADSEEVRFFFADGTAALLSHEQQCCEWVALADVAGDPCDLIDSPLLMAHEAVNDENPSHSESSTWTFYLFATIKGFVTLRWVGESNGYYSEFVDFCDITPHAGDAADGEGGA